RIETRPRDDVARRALQHRHVGGAGGERGNERHRGRAAADDDDALAGDVEAFGPELRADQRPGVFGFARELGAMAFVVAVVAAADVEKAGPPRYRRAIVDALAVHRPERVGARPLGAAHDVAEADLRDDAGLLGRGADVAKDRRPV